MASSLYVATDNAGIACIRLFSCILPQAPAWSLFCTTPEAIAAIPDGARCVGLWSSSRRIRSAAEWAWIERRERGGLKPGLSNEDMESLAAWIAKRGEAATNLAPASITEQPASDPVSMPASPIPTVHQPAPAPIAGAVISSRWS